MAHNPIPTENTQSSQKRDAHLQLCVFRIPLQTYSEWTIATLSLNNTSKLIRQHIHDTLLMPPTELMLLVDKHQPLRSHELTSFAIWLPKSLHSKILETSKNLRLLKNLAPRAHYASKNQLLHTILKHATESVLSQTPDPAPQQPL